MGISHRWAYESIVQELKQSENSEFPLRTSGKVNLALVFPGPYPIGMSNLGFLTVHRLLLEIPELGVERFFFPIMPGKPHPAPFYSFETCRPLADFDILAFSISYEGDFARLPSIFGPLGISLLRKKRKGRLPLLIAGGAAVGANPDALKDIFDVLVPGEAEPILAEMMESLLRNALDPTSLAKIPGIWLSESRENNFKSTSPFKISDSPAFSHIVSKKNLFGGTPLLEVMRGCPRNCCFCLARRLYFPPRFVPCEKIESWLDSWPGVQEIGLIAPSLFDHPEIESILQMLVKKKLKLRNSSVKWEKLSPGILRNLFSLGVKTLTLAPETGSPALRLNMRKPLPDKDFFDMITQIADQGFENLKLYFMVGLPGESFHDLELTLEMIKKTWHTCEGKIKTLSLAFSGFVPKKGTVWEKERIFSQSEFKSRFKFLRAGIREISPSIKANFESPREIALQAFFSRVGSELAEKLEVEATEWKSRGKTVKQDFFSEF